jgi:hypothetical protein
MDILDDQGDGKFRDLVIPGHATELIRNPPPQVPEWAMKPKA